MFNSIAIETTMANGGSNITADMLRTNLGNGPTNNFQLQMAISSTSRQMH
jgi:hypothetical protein